MELESLEWFGIAATVFFAASEIVGMNPKWKSNSVVQVVLVVLGRVFKRGG